MEVRREKYSALAPPTYSPVIGPKQSHAQTSDNIHSLSVDLLTDRGKIREDKEGKMGKSKKKREKMRKEGKKQIKRGRKKRD